jgi:tetraacyldisaccharide 4'-kinase
MFQQAFPEFPVAIGSDRIMQGKKAVAKYGKKLQCILVEDGLQQWKVKRDLQIVMVDALHPFGNGKMIPCGSLREKPQDAIARTDIVVIHHANLVEQNQYKKLRKELETMANPEKRMVIAGSRLIVDDLVSLHGASSNTTTCKKKEPVKEISQGKIALVFCGVGNAASVEAVVKNIQGWYQVQMEVFPDHYSFVQSELEALQHQAQELQNSTGKEVMILTTEKDYHRSHQLMKKVFSSKNKAKQTVEMRILKCRLEIIDNKQQVHTKVHKILCLV